MALKNRVSVRLLHRRQLSCASNASLLIRRPRYLWGIGCVAWRNGKTKSAGFAKLRTSLARRFSISASIPESRRPSTFSCQKARRAWTPVSLVWAPARILRSIIWARNPREPRMALMPKYTVKPTKRSGMIAARRRFFIAVWRSSVFGCTFMAPL